MPDPFAAVPRGNWLLDPEWAFLNHGSYGACPIAVLEAQSALRARLERQPLRFMGGLEKELDEARAALAAFLGADADDVAFVRNATEGVNAVLRSMRFEPGDELLETSHEYNACSNALRFVCDRWGSTPVTAPVPFLLPSPEHVVTAVMERVTPRTRFAMISHVTSPTGLVLPVERLTRELQSRGVFVLIDGAHAPGMLPLQLDAIGADAYVGNCHKWMCAPKGAGFLHVKRERQKAISPAVISHGRNSNRTDRSMFRLEFDWTGTFDPTPWLCVPEALRIVGAMKPGGWDEVMRANRAKVLAARALLCEALGVAPPVPEEFIGSLAAVPIPDDLRAADNAESLYARLNSEKIEVPIIGWPSPRRLVRLSAHLYNTRAEYERLIAFLVAARGR